MERIHGSVADVVNRLVEDGFINTNYFPLRGANRIVLNLAEKHGIYISKGMRKSRKYYELLKTREKCVDKGYLENSRGYNAPKEHYGIWFEACKASLSVGLKANSFNTGDFFNDFVPPQLINSVPKKELLDITFSHLREIGAEFLEGQWPTKMGQMGEKDVNKKNCALTGTIVNLDEYPYPQFIDEILTKIQIISEYRNDDFYSEIGRIPPSLNQYIW